MVKKELIKAKDPGFNIKVIPGAGIQNMSKIQQGDTEIAWGLPPFIAASYNGQDPYKDKHGDMRLVMNGLGFVHVRRRAARDQQRGRERRRAAPALGAVDVDRARR